MTVQKQLEDFKITLVDLENVNQIDKTQLNLLNQFENTSKHACAMHSYEINKILSVLNYLNNNCQQTEIDVLLLISNIRMSKLKLYALLDICKSTNSKTQEMSDLIRTIATVISTDTLTPLIKLLIHYNEQTLLNMQDLPTRWIPLILFYEIQGKKDFDIKYLNILGSYIVELNYTTFISMTKLAETYEFEKDSVFWRIYEPLLFPLIKLENIKLFKTSYLFMYNMYLENHLLLYYALIYYSLDTYKFKDSLLVHILEDLEGKDMRFALKIEEYSKTHTNPQRNRSAEYLLAALSLICEHSIAYFIKDILRYLHEDSTRLIISLIDMVNNQDEIINNMKYIYDIGNLQQALQGLIKYAKYYPIDKLSNKTHLCIKSTIYLLLK